MTRNSEYVLMFNMEWTKPEAIRAQVDKIRRIGVGSATVPSDSINGINNVVFSTASDKSRESDAFENLSRFPISQTRIASIETKQHWQPWPKRQSGGAWSPTSYPRHSAAGPPGWCYWCLTVTDGGTETLRCTSMPITPSLVFLMDAFCAEQKSDFRYEVPA